MDPHKQNLSLGINKRTLCGFYSTYCVLQPECKSSWCCILQSFQVIYVLKINLLLYVFLNLVVFFFSL